MLGWLDAASLCDDEECGHAECAGARAMAAELVRERLAYDQVTGAWPGAPEGGAGEPK